MSDKPVQHIIEDNEALVEECARLQSEVERLRGRCGELEADARRYRFFRENQSWRRLGPRLDEPGYDFIGLKFDIHNGFTAQVYLDHAIDQRLRQQADEAEKAGGG